MIPYCRFLKVQKNLYNFRRYSQFKCFSHLISKSKNHYVHIRRSLSPTSSSSSSFSSARADALTAAMKEKNRRIAYYTGALAVMIFGVAYASVPIYKGTVSFCIQSYHMITYIYTYR